MNQMFPRPRFWDEAAQLDHTRFSMLGELMVFWLLFLVSMIGQALLWSVSTVPWIFSAQGTAALATLSPDKSMEQAMLELTRLLPDWMGLVDAFAYVAIGLTAILYCRRVQKRSLASMGLRGRFLPEYILGMLVGALVFAGVLALGIVTGAYRPNFSGLCLDRLPLVFCGLLACNVQGLSMVLMVQGYFAPSLAKRFSVLSVLLLSALAPVMLYGELSSLSGINSLLLGLILGVWVIKRGNLWGAGAIYGVWFFAENVLFHFATAGERTGIYLLPVEIDPYRVMLTGGEAGPLGGICATVILLGVLMLILPLHAKDPAPPEPPRNEGAANNL